MNENVKSVTVIYLKCATTFLEPRHPPLSFLVCCQPQDTWIFLRQLRVNWRRQSIYCERRSWGENAQDFMENPFSCEREMLPLQNLPYSCLGIWKEVKTEPSPTFPFVYLPCLYSSLFFLVGKKKEKQKNQNMGQTLKRGERKMSKATATRHTRNCGCHGEAPSSELHGSATSQPAWLLGCVWVCMTVLGPITQSEQELGRTGVIYSLQGHIPPSLRNCGFWETKQIYSAYLWFYQQI